MINIAKEKCNGCGACYNKCAYSAIKMEADIEGFLYPKVDNLLCIECNQCINSCPILSGSISANNVSEAYAAQALDTDIRLKSSSGGIFTLLSNVVLELNGIVIGAGFNDEFYLEHLIIDKKENLNILRGSKYIQSDINLAYRECQKYLESNKLVLFSGLPCQIAGLIKYLNKDYDNLYSIDFVCHGVPSPKVWKKYKTFVENKIGSFENVSFRDKENSWEHYNLKCIGENNVRTKSLYDDEYLKIFLGDLSLRLSCYECQFKSISHISDLTLGDFWGISTVLPNYDDKIGTSMVIVQSRKGYDLFSKIFDLIKSQEIAIEKLVKLNPAIEESAKMPINRGEFFKDLDRLDFNALSKKYPKISMEQKMRKALFNCIVKVKQKLHK
ncbi:MAG: Coenzyme F420 hydrogenase/dehydrogenase, beta subunit C-terminal domain [Bacilli bacterium]